MGISDIEVEIWISIGLDFHTFFQNEHLLSITPSLGPLTFDEI